MAAGRPAAVGGAALSPLAWLDLPAWGTDDHAAAFLTWLASCRREASGEAVVRPGAAAPQGLKAVQRQALAAGALDRPGARRFFEQSFVPCRVGAPGSAFVTGYYEPEVAGSPHRTPHFATAALARPPDLVTLGPDHGLAGLEGLAAARRAANGRLVPYPDRAAIETGALDGLGLDLLYLADPVELFFVQVQGSARVRLPDGTVARLAYDGRNGHPYTAIGRVLADRLGVPRAGMTMAVLRDWLARHPAEGRAVMRANRSYVFFRLATELDPGKGPLGGEGVPLEPGRSVAVDRALWPYGLPVWLETSVPGVGPMPADPMPADLMPTEPVRRLTVAQDTGTAIVGPARLDLFLGSGAAAGARAGAMRAAGDMVVLWPAGTAP